MPKPGRKPGSTGAGKQLPKANPEVPTATKQTGKGRLGWPTQKKRLHQELSTCSGLPEVCAAFEAVLGTDWVTTVSRWSAAQLESVVGLLVDHVDGPEILAAADPNEALVAALQSARDLADSDEEEMQPPRRPTKGAKKGTKKVGSPAPSKGKAAGDVREQLLELAAIIGKQGQAGKVEEEEEESEEEDFLTKLKDALAGADGASRKPKKTKGVTLPTRAQVVNWRVQERVLPEVLEDANDNGGGIKSWIMATRQGGWRNQESRKVVMNIALAMDTLFKELGPAAGELAGVEYLMRVVAAMLLVESQGSGGWKVAGHLLALKEDASLVSNPAMKMALQSATMMEKLGKAQQTK